MWRCPEITIFNWRLLGHTLGRPGIEGRLWSGGSESGNEIGVEQESYREAVLSVVVKRDDGINDGKIRMSATLESCKGNACDTLEREATVYIVEKATTAGR